jgi:hypothetical protein
MTDTAKEEVNRVKLSVVYQSMVVRSVREEFAVDQQVNVKGL